MALEQARRFRTCHRTDLVDKQRLEPSVRPGLQSNAVAIVLLAVVGCGAPKADANETQCVEVEGSLAAGFDVAALRGEFELTLAATSGDSAGKVVVGSLTLVRVDSALLAQVTDRAERPGDFPYALLGSMNVALEGVTAHRLGDLRSLDPMSPGVAVLVDGDSVSPRVTLRVGSQSNQVGVRLFDGAYTALRVNWAEERGFGGTWASGVRGPEAGGYFCAFRPVGGN